VKGRHIPSFYVVSCFSVVMDQDHDDNGSLSWQERARFKKQQEKAIFDERLKSFPLNKARRDLALAALESAPPRLGPLDPLQSRSGGGVQTGGQGSVLGHGEHPLCSVVRVGGL
jgi:hypothetical protein